MGDPTVGSVNFGPRTVLMGDCGAPEAIIPLDQFGKFGLPTSFRKEKGPMDLTIKIGMDTTELMESLAKVKAELQEIIALQEKAGLINSEPPQTEEQMFEFLKNLTQEIGGIK